MIREHQDICSTPETKSHIDIGPVASGDADEKPIPILDHPLHRVAGCFENDPSWNDLMDAIDEYRERVDPQEP